MVEIRLDCRGFAQTGGVRVRVKTVRTARIENVGKYESCMVTPKESRVQMRRPGESPETPRRLSPHIVKSESQQASANNFSGARNQKIKYRHISVVHGLSNRTVGRHLQPQDRELAVARQRSTPARPICSAQSAPHSQQRKRAFKTNVNLRRAWHPAPVPRAAATSEGRKTRKLLQSTATARACVACQPSTASCIRRRSLVRATQL